MFLLNDDGTLTVDISIEAFPFSFFALRSGGISSAYSSCYDVGSPRLRIRGCRSSSRGGVEVIMNQYIDAIAAETSAILRAIPAGLMS